MKFIKGLQAKYVSLNRKVGELLFADGLCDITDPCYDNDVWCALHNVKILPGEYGVFVDEVNYPSIYEYETTKETIVQDDVRIMTLTIIHKDYINIVFDGNCHKRKLSNNIGVDAGMCGFYNHKPDFNDDEWNKFWNSLDVNDYGNNCDCRHANGVTVSSGFGDGFYTVYKLTYNKKTIGLKLQFK